VPSKQRIDRTGAARTRGSTTRADVIAVLVKGRDVGRACEQNTQNSDKLLSPCMTIATDVDHFNSVIEVTSVTRFHSGVSARLVKVLRTIVPGLMVPGLTDITTIFQHVESPKVCSLLFQLKAENNASEIKHKPQAITMFQPSGPGRAVARLPLFQMRQMPRHILQSTEVSRVMRMAPYR